MDARTPQRRTVARAIGLVVATAAFVPPARAVGQIRFVRVEESLGLHHVNTYGQTFSFSDDQWPLGSAFVLQVMQRNMGNGAAVGDYDNDGDLDVYLLSQLGIPNRLFRNDATPSGRSFVDVTDSAGVGDVGLGRVAHFADLDNNGFEDLLLINDDDSGGTYPSSRLFRNDGDGVFTDVTDGSGFIPVGHIKGGACLGDYDNDGLLDVYLGLWLLEGGTGTRAFTGYNRLFRNLGDFHFRDVTLDVGLGRFDFDSFTCVFADFDNDGDSDLYVAVDHTSDVYYRNDGGRFIDDTLSIGATHTGNDMGVAVADFDEDGDLDVFSTNITDPTGASGTTQHNILLVYQPDGKGHDRFIDEGAARGVADSAWGWGTEFVDVDNDGDLDLYAVNGFDEWVRATQGSSHPLLETPAALFINDGTGHYSVSAGTGAEVLLDSRAAIAFDYDRDGDQDLLVTNVGGPTVLLENRTAGTGHWLDIELVGGCGSNADAIGARVHIRRESETLMREIIAGGSYLSGRPYGVHFGLGGDSTVAAIEIRWPDGATMIIDPASHVMTVDRRITVHRLFGDGDLSDTVDLRDFAMLQNCYGRLGRMPECSAFDFDLDEAIDQIDFARFVALLKLHGSCCGAIN